MRIEQSRRLSSQVGARTKRGGKRSAGMALPWARLRLAVMVVGLASVGLCWVAQAQASAPGFIFWSNKAGVIGRANLDGSGPNQGLVRTASAHGVAVDRQHVYWTGNALGSGGTIGRATWSGTDVKQDFISVGGRPYRLILDARYIYWTDPGRNTIGRSKLDGTDVEPNFITLGGPPSGVAVDGQHIYWTAFGFPGVGRANLDGTGVNQDFIFTLTTAVDDLVVDAQHIYWSTLYDGIGRANLDGTAIHENFINKQQALGPDALALAGSRIYWTNFFTGSISQAKLDGTGVTNDLVRGVNAAGLAVTGAALPRASASTTKLEFGTHALLDYGKPKSVTITDTGTAPLQISGVQLGAANAADFLVSQDNCSGNLLRVGASCEISVLFGPRAVGRRSATLSIASDDGLSPLLITLSGTGASQTTATSGARERITCKPLKAAVNHRRHVVRRRSVRCTGTMVSALGSFKAAKAIISRGSVSYARGSIARSGATGLRLVLTKLRPLRPGRYVLSVRYRRGRRSVLRGIPISIVR